MIKKFAFLLLPPLYFSTVHAQHEISFGSLIEEMTDLNRLTRIEDPSYRVVQFSSYDRRSRVPGEEGWFANSDGFGSEPIPGFVETLTAPESDGTGTYLMCEVNGPGTIQRLWTAGIEGKITLYLDGNENPVFEGKAEDFFWSTPKFLAGDERADTLSGIFRQFDASYFPVPFQRRCRIEWTGDIHKIHFYQIGIRMYDKDVAVKTYTPDDVSGAVLKIRRLQKIFNGTDRERDRLPENRKEFVFELASGSDAALFKSAGTGVLDYFSVRVHSGNVESALRNCIVKIYCDASAVPQVEAPLGDFFGAGPGLNPYQSLPFSVGMDSLMVCRFPMPFRDSLRVMVGNLSDKPVQIKGQYHIGGYEWEEGASMYFRAGWAMDRGLKASNIMVRDIPYQLIQGTGRIVGISACLYNPSEAVTSWGNWWGEGDEKIFFDGEKFPSFFGTGSEDYFNYSWSSESIFFFPYCGQPRNDGPGNRGHVSNFRWHIFDDLAFTESIAFYMELLHHGEVPGFSYGRMVYAYALPGSIDDRIPVTGNETGDIPYDYWKPEAYLGSAGFSFFQAEELLSDDPEVHLQEGNRWSAGKILNWEPVNQDERLEFILDIPENGQYILGLTLAHLPGGGEIWIRVNDEPVKFSASDTIELAEPGHIQLRNHFSKPVYLSKGNNQLSIGTTTGGTGKEVGIDFFWLKGK